MRRSLSASGLLRLFLLAALVPLGIQTSAGQSGGADPTAGFTVAGSVVNSVTGQPVARALVVLNQDFAMLTGAGGEFAFAHVPAGRYRVWARKPGYLGADAPAGPIRVFDALGGAGSVSSSAAYTRDFVVEADTRDLVLRLMPGSVITGQITLSTADPADDMQVLVLRKQLQNGRYRWTSAGFARTRSDGSFRIANLPPGSYRLQTQTAMEHPGVLAGPGAAVWGYPAMYYPGVTDPASAGVLALAAGQNAEADLTLTLQRFFPMTAAVLSSQPDSPLNFEILDSGGRTTPLETRFDLNARLVRAAVPPGSWSLLASGFGRQRYWGRTDFQMTGAPLTTTISVVPIPKISVLIRRDTSSSVNPRAGSPDPGVSLLLVPADDSRFGGGYLHQNPPGSDHWVLDVGRPGTYWVQANATSSSYVSSVTSGGLDLSTQPLIIQPGSPVAPIEVTLRDDGGSIAGRVHEPGPPAGNNQPQVWIYAIPLFATAGDLPRTSVQLSGQFTLTNLVPGAYRVIACDAPQSIDFRSAQGVAEWAGKGQTVTVDAGSTATVDLAIIRSEAGPGSGQ